MNSNKVNRLFYSQHCEMCKNLLLLLKNENLLCFFQLICVDTILNQLPPDMRVPTMTLVTSNKPLIGAETFEWIQSIKFIKSNQTNDTNKKQQQHQPHRGPIGYDNDIMSGISDTFAFTKTDDPLPHAYFGINEEKKHAIFTAPDNNNERISNHDQTKLSKELELRRKHQDVYNSNVMKQEQINAVLRSGQDATLQNRNFTN